MVVWRRRPSVWRGSRRWPTRTCGVEGCRHGGGVPPRGACVGRLDQLCFIFEYSLPIV